MLNSNHLDVTPLSSYGPLAESTLQPVAKVLETLYRILA